jgi:hypothetical protein
MKQLILKLDSRNNLSKYSVDVKGSRFPGKTLKIDKSERYLLVNCINKSILIASLHPDSVESFIEAKNDITNTMKDDFTDFLPLLNDRILTLNRNGLLTLWRFNVFKNEVNAIYDVSIKKNKIEGMKEEFISLSICDQNKNIAITSTYGHLMNRSRLSFAWVTEHDYVYLSAEKNLVKKNPANKQIKTKLE